MSVTEVMKDGLNRRNALVVAVLSAILGSTGGPFVLTKFGVNPYRVDPATGTEVRLLQDKVKRLQNHVDFHPDVVNKFETRITAVETNQLVIIRNQERILDKLDQSRK